VCIHCTSPSHFARQFGHISEYSLTLNDALFFFPVLLLRFLFKLSFAKIKDQVITSPAFSPAYFTISCHMHLYILNDVQICFLLSLHCGLTVFPYPARSMQSHPPFPAVMPGLPIHRVPLLLPILPPFQPG